LYRDSVAELRRQRAAEEEELEKILQQERNKIEAERKEKLLRLEASRQKLKNVSWFESAKVKSYLTCTEYFSDWPT
jgi:hypothetical protein